MFFEFPEDKLLSEDPCIGPSIDIPKILDDAIDNSLIVEIELRCFGELFSFIGGKRWHEREHKSTRKDVEIALDLSARDACDAAKRTFLELCTIVEREPGDRFIKREYRFFLKKSLDVFCDVGLIDSEEILSLFKVI